MKHLHQKFLLDIRIHRQCLTCTHLYVWLPVGILERRKTLYSKSLLKHFGILQSLFYCTLKNQV